MMKFMVGYQLNAREELIPAVIRGKTRIHEVYFPWGDIPTGRGVPLERSGLPPFEAQNMLINDLTLLSGEGIGLNLLLNGNCYGKDSLSRAFFEKTGNAVDYLANRFLLCSVTTSSPLIGKFLKANFTGLEIRASVNMEIGTIQGMEYVAPYFDGYYMDRDYNRCLSRIRELKQWCDDNGKRLYLLANSGCLNHCSVHNFHDNLVAHEQEIRVMDNAYEFRGICHDYLRDRTRQEQYLRDTNFIRPEDIPLYEPYFAAVKLATRTNRNPVRVMDAYLSGSYCGNLMELMEPDHAEAFYPAILENSRIPAEFGNHVLNCPKNCGTCDYCKTVFNNAKHILESGGIVSC